MLSLDVLSKIVISSESDKDERKTSFNLSSRYLSLSSSFQSLQMKNEALLSLCMSLKFFILESLASGMIEEAKETTFNNIHYGIGIIETLNIHYNTPQFLLRQPGSFITFNNDQANFISWITKYIIHIYSDSENIDLNHRRGKQISSYFTKILKKSLIGQLLAKLQDKKCGNYTLSFSAFIKTLILYDAMEISEDKDNILIFKLKLGVIKTLAHKLGQATRQKDPKWLHAIHVTTQSLSMLVEARLSSKVNTITHDVAVLIPSSLNFEQNTNYEVPFWQNEYMIEYYISSIASLLSSDNTSSLDEENSNNDRSRCILEFEENARTCLMEGLKRFDDSTSAYLKYLTYGIIISMMMVEDSEDIQITTKSSQQTTIFNRLSKKSLTPYEMVLADCTKVVKIMSEIHDEYIQINDIITILSVIVTKIYHKMSFNGSAISAMQSLKVLSLLRHFGGSESNHLDLLYSFVLAEGGLSECSYDLLHQYRMNFDPKLINSSKVGLAGYIVDRSNEAKSYFKAENYEKCQILIHKVIIPSVLHFCNDILLAAESYENFQSPSNLEEITQICESQKNMMPELFDSQERINVIDPLLSISIDWWISTCYFVQSRLLEKLGYLQKSIRTLHDCLHVSRRALTASRQKRPWFRKRNIMPQTILSPSHPSNFTWPLSARISDCLFFMSKIHSKLGDYRRANSYVLKSAESVGFILSDTKMSISNIFNETLVIGNQNISTPRLSGRIQDILDIYSLSVNRTFVNHEIKTNIGVYLSNYKNMNFSFETDEGTLSLEKAEWTRELIRHFIARKYLEALSSYIITLIHRRLTDLIKLPNLSSLSYR